MKIQKFKKGFSIGEVMLSAVVLGVSLVIIAGLMSTSIRHSADSRNQIIASELAQEGVELVRNIRDNNIASGAVTLFENIPNGNNCRIDKNYAYPSSLPCDGNYQLKYDGEFYQHNAGADTNFFRRIIVEDYSAGNSNPIGKKITSIVQWNGKMFNGNAEQISTNCNATLKCVYVQEILTNR